MAVGYPSISKDGKACVFANIKSLNSSFVVILGGSVMFDKTAVCLIGIGVTSKVDILRSALVNHSKNHYKCCNMTTL